MKTTSPAASGKLRASSRAGSGLQPPGRPPSVCLGRRASPFPSGFVHDDGFMICCDACSVWQHIECVQVDPRHLPENYHCELCAPRSVDRKRARAIQLKKKEDMTGKPLPCATPSCSELPLPHPS